MIYREISKVGPNSTIGHDTTDDHDVAINSASVALSDYYYILYTG